MAMGAGLGFPVGVSAPLRFRPQPPIKNAHFGTVLSSGKGGAHEADFGTRPERTAGTAGKTDREATPKRHQQNKDDDHA